MDKLIITLSTYDYRCADGCCSDEFIKIEIEGKETTYTKYSYSSEINPIIEILESLGYEVELIDKIK